MVCNVTTLEHLFYHSTVQAILFLAPLLFNQMLEEDRGVNRVVRPVLHYSVALIKLLLQ